MASLPEFGPYALTHGVTYEEALEHAKEVLDLLIEDTSPLPSPRTFHRANDPRLTRCYVL